MGRRAWLAGVVGAFGFAAVCAAVAAPGQLDSSFGNGGKVLTDLGGADYSGSIAIAPSGAVVVAGGSGDDVALARYDAAGRLDPTFGERGTVVTDLGTDDDGADAIALQTDGKVVVAGHRGVELALARYSAGGTLDPSFDGDGIVLTDLGGRPRAFGLLRRADGRLVVLAAVTDALVLARYLRDGRLDTSFGRGGTVVMKTPGIEWRNAVRGRDGTIVVVGARITTRLAQAMAMAVARFLPDGGRDRTFSGDGLTVTSARRHWAGALHVAVRGDGRIVLGTHGHAGKLAGFALVRLRRNGSLDPTFGNGGVSVSGVGYGVHAMGLDRRGRIVTVGRTQSLLDFVVARFLPDGRRDRSFAATVADFGGVDTPFALAIQPDAKFVVAGASSPSGPGLVGDIAVARYLSSR